MSTSQTANKSNPTKVITGKVRFSYANVWKAVKQKGSETEKFSCALLIPKSDAATIKIIKAAIQEAANQGKDTKFKGAIPKNLKHPLHDGDAEKDDDIYADHFYIQAYSSTRPGIVDKDVQPILNQDEFYSGCYGRASINFYAYNTNGAMGIACGLNNLQKLEDGDRLGGRQTAEFDFGGGDYSGENNSLSFLD